MGMTNELSTEKAIEALYTVRAYYASLTAGYPKGKDCRGIGDVMCSEIANSCLMAIKALEQQQNVHDTCKKCVEFSEFEPQPCEDCISRKDALDVIEKEKQGWEGSERYAIDECHTRIAELPSITPKGVTITDFADRCRECGKQKVGKWKRISPAGIYECTNCNQVIMTSDIDCYKYCHGCGVRMEGEE